MSDLLLFFLQGGEEEEGGREEREREREKGRGGIRRKEGREKRQGFKFCCQEVEVLSTVLAA